MSGHLIVGSFDSINSETKTKENFNPRAHETGGHEGSLAVADTTGCFHKSTLRYFLVRMFF